MNRTTATEQAQTLLFFNPIDHLFFSLTTQTSSSVPPSAYYGCICEWNNANVSNEASTCWVIAPAPNLEHKWKNTDSSSCSLFLQASLIPPKRSTERRYNRQQHQTARFRTITTTMAQVTRRMRSRGWKTSKAESLLASGFLQSNKKV